MITEILITFIITIFAGLTMGIDAGIQGIVDALKFTSIIALFVIAIMAIMKEIKIK